MHRMELSAGTMRGPERGPGGMGPGGELGRGPGRKRGRNQGADQEGTDRGPGGYLLRGTERG